VNFTLDPAQSTVSTTLEISGVGDSDASPLSGFVELDLDAPAAPSAASLIDFSIAADETINYNLSLGFLGGLTASISDLLVFYDGLAPLGPVAVTGGAATFTNVPALQSGAGEYDATGLVCSTLQGSNLPCSDTFNLADEGQTIIPEIAGVISLADPQTLRLDVALSFSTELDPDSPGLGTFTFTVDAVAFAALPAEPCAGDATGDGLVNADDLLAVLGAFGTATSGGAAAGDLTGDGLVNADDLLAVLGAFGTACP